MEGNNDYKVTIAMDDNSNIIFFLDDGQIKQVESRYIHCTNAGSIMDITDFLEDDPDTDFVTNLVNSKHIAQFMIERYYGEEDNE